MAFYGIINVLLGGTPIDSMEHQLCRLNRLLASSNYLIGDTRFLGNKKRGEGDASAYAHLSFIIRQGPKTGAPGDFWPKTDVP